MTLHPHLAARWTICCLYPAHSVALFSLAGLGQPWLTYRRTVQEAWEKESEEIESQILQKTTLLHCSPGRDSAGTDPKEVALPSLICRHITHHNGELTSQFCRPHDGCTGALQQHAMLLDWCTRVGCSFPAPARLASARPSLWQGANSAMQPTPEATARRVHGRQVKLCLMPALLPAELQKGSEHCKA